MSSSTLLDSPIPSTMRASLRSLREDWHDEMAPDEARGSLGLSEDIQAREDASDAQCVREAREAGEFVSYEAFRRDELGL